MEEYKDSGIVWIGKIPKGWKLKKIKYITQIPVTDGPHETPTFVDEGIPFYSVDGIQNGKIIYEPCRFISVEDADRYDQKERPIKGDILMGKAASIGKIAIIDKNIRMQIWSPLAIIRANDKIVNNIFLKYYLLSDSSQIEIDLRSTTNTQKNIAMKDIENIYVPMPDLSEQKMIANFLDEKTSKIDSILYNLNKQIEILNNYKKYLITETITKGLVSNRKMKDSGIKSIGLIPENWQYKKLKYLLKENSNNLKVGPFGSALSGDDFKDEGYWVYNQRTVLDNNFNENDAFINENKYSELKGFKVYPNDILITTRGTIGKVAIVPKSAKPGILHPCLIRFVLNNQLIRNELVELIFNESNIINEQIYRQSNATTIEVLYSYTLKELFLPVIPLNEQDEIINYLSKMRLKIDNIINDKKKQIKKMEQFKQSLIYEYVTGKKRVKGE